MIFKIAIALLLTSFSVFAQEMSTNPTSYDGCLKACEKERQACLYQHDKSNSTDCWKDYDYCVEQRCDK